MSQKSANFGSPRQRRMKKDRQLTLFDVFSPAKVAKGSAADVEQNEEDLQSDLEEIPLTDETRPRDFTSSEPALLSDAVSSSASHPTKVDIADYFRKAVNEQLTPETKIQTDL